MGFSSGLVNYPDGYSDTKELIELCKVAYKYDVPFVPVLDENFIMPDNFEELKKMADGKSVINPKYRREGFVYRSLDGKQSCKNVSTDYLMHLKD